MPALWPGYLQTGNSQIKVQNSFLLGHFYFWYTVWLPLLYNSQVIMLLLFWRTFLSVFFFCFSLCVRMCVCVWNLSENVKKKNVTFSSGLNILGSDDNGSNNAQESSPNEESNDSSDDIFSKLTKYKWENGSTCSASCLYGSRSGVRTRSRDQSKSLHPTNSEWAYLGSESKF